MDSDEIDLLDRDRFTEGVPHEWFSWLRANAPVFHHPEPGGPGFWVLSRYDDVVAASRDPRTFSSSYERGGVIGLERPPAAAGDQGPEDAAQGRMMLVMDAPDHTRYRKLVNRGFTPRAVATLEERVRAIAGRIVERAVATGDCDAVVDLAVDLPLEVIAELLGIPEGDRHKVFTWSNRLIGSEDPEYAVSVEETRAAQVEMFTYAQALADQRRAAPRDDIVSTLLAGEVEGEKLSDLDFDLFFMLLAVAGNETTRNAIAHGVNAFLEHPDQWDRLAAAPGELLPTAVEEVLRWASPVLYFRRNVTRDVVVRGTQLRAGDKVSLWYASANRDEAHFADPFRFDIGRDPNPHIAFGGGGPHFCLGAQLARLELRALFDELVRRVSHMEARGAPDRLRSNFVGGIKHLPVRLHPRDGRP